MSRYNRALRELRRERPKGYGSSMVGRGLVLAGGFAAAVAIFATLSVPAKTSAITLDDIRRAIEHSSIRHEMFYNVLPDGKETLRAEVWRGNGRIRVNNKGIWFIEDQKRSWGFIPAQKLVQMTLNEGDEPDTSLVVDSMPELEKAIHSSSPESQVTLEERQENGHRTLRMTRQSSMEWGGRRHRTLNVWEADVKDKLPRWMRIYQGEEPADGKEPVMHLFARVTYDYPSRVPEGTFDFKVPKGWSTKVVAIRRSVPSGGKPTK